MKNLIGLRFFFNFVILASSAFSSAALSSNKGNTMSQSETKESFIKFIKSKIDEAKKKDQTTEYIFDESKITCVDTTCEGTLVSKSGSSKSTSKIKFSFNNGKWVDDRVKKMEEAKKASDEIEKKLGTNNRYSLSILVGTGASLEVFIDGKSEEIFKTHADSNDTTVSGLLPLAKGKHKVEIRFTGKVEKWVYTYELKEYPKETDPSEALFNDSYIIFGTGKKEGGFSIFVREKLDKVKSIVLQVEAK